MTDTNTGPEVDADVQAVDQLHQKYLEITQRMEGVIVGQEEVIEQLLVALLCRGTAFSKAFPAWPRPSWFPPWLPFSTRLSAESNSPPI